MKEEDSFHSAKSEFSDEVENILNKNNNNDNNKNALLLNNLKEKNDNTIISRNSNIINQNKIQIRKSLMFSNLEDTFQKSTEADIFKNSLNFQKNLLSKNGPNLPPEYIKNLNFSQKNISEPYLEIPDEKNKKIVLVKIIDQNYFEGHLKLKNNLKTDYLIFKILNDKQIYSITPTLYFIEPGKDITINIKRFEKLTINEIKNIIDYIVVLVAHTKNKIDDVNDARIYINKNNLYSPEYQSYSYIITLDYGYNTEIYEKEKKERENIFNKYESQLNLNKITDVKIIKKYIENVKKDIEIYKNKIENLKSILGDIGKKNIIKQEETIFDKETYIEASKGKVYKEFDEEEYEDNFIELPLLFLYISICLFIGKYLKYFLYNK